MRAKVTELSNKLYWIQDDNTPLEHIEAFNNCTTTLSELKEMWDNEKVWKEVDNVCKSIIGDDEFVRSVIFESLKNSPRKFTIEQVMDIALQTELNTYSWSESQILEHLYKLPQNGIEVEIEGNKIVKVYV